MNRLQYLSALKNAHHRSSIWITLFLVMLVLNVVQTMTLLGIDKNQQTIIVPAHLDKSFFIQGSKASAEYIEQMARYLSQMLLTYQSSNVEAQFNTVLKYVSPASHGVLYKQYQHDLERIHKNKISSIFHVMKMNIYENTALIEGEVTIIIDSKVISRKMKAYEMQFAYVNRQFYLSTFQEIVQDEAVPRQEERGLVSEQDIQLQEVPS